MKSEEPGIIREGALFVADAHYPHHGKAFLRLLQKLHDEEIVVPQLFLMGDIFDLLFGYDDYIRRFSAEAIVLLQHLSARIEIHYFEGNHDFLLKDIFPSVAIYPRESQPVLFDMSGRRTALSHGDKFALGFAYDLYCRLLRSRWLITILRPFDRWIIDDRIAKLKRKDICRPMQHFDERAEEIVAAYPDVDLIIEGHYHEGKRRGKYLSLPSLACQEQVAVVREGKVVFCSIGEL